MVIHLNALAGEWRRGDYEKGGKRVHYGLELEGLGKNSACISLDWFSSLSLLPISQIN